MPTTDADNLRLAVAVLASLLLHTALALLPTGYVAPGKRTDRAEAEPSAPRQTNLTIRLPRRPEPPADQRSDRKLPTENAAPPLTAGLLSEIAKPDDAPHVPADDLIGVPVHFVAESLLSRRPRPRTPINLDLPEFAAAAIDGKLRATLFIDSSGSVVAFQAGDSNLADEQAAALGRVFTATKFHPGEIAGQPVSARINIVIRVQPNISANPATANAVFNDRLR